MFKLKPGNVFQKLNTMDKKQAYTWGAIVVVCFIALITLASFLGDAEDASFDEYATRGYDLAQMPFVNDEAEEYLLASKYPDMKENGSTMLYSAAEKEARQEADAEAASEREADIDSSADSSESSSRSYSGRGYTGGRGGGGTGSPTQVGSLGSASMGHAGGSGMSGTFGAPRGDFSTYNRSQDKGTEIPSQMQLKNTDARRALSQFAQTSRAAAGLRDGKGGNAKRALMGGNIKGSDAFTETGVDLSKANGLALDTNAPTSSADLSNLDKKVDDGAKAAKDKNDKDKQDLSDKLLEQFLTGLVNLGLQAVGGLIDKGLNEAFGAIDAAGAKGRVNNQFQDTLNTLSPSDVTPGSPLESTMQNYLGKENYNEWKADPNRPNAGSFIQKNSIDVKSNMKTNAEHIHLPSRNETDHTFQIGASLATSRSEAAAEARGSYVGRKFIDTSNLPNPNSQSKNSQDKDKDDKNKDDKDK